MRNAGIILADAGEMAIQGPCSWISRRQPAPKTGMTDAADRDSFVLSAMRQRFLKRAGD